YNALCLSQPADLGTGQAIAPRIKGWPGDHDVRSKPSEDLLHGRFRGVQLFGEGVITGDNRGHDASASVEEGLQGSPRTHRPFLHLHRCVRVLFAAKAAEKLVEVVHNSRRTIHSAPLLPVTYNLAFRYSCCCICLRTVVPTRCKVNTDARIAYMGPP